MTATMGPTAVEDVDAEIVDDEEDQVAAFRFRSEKEQRLGIDFIINFPSF